MAYGRFRNSSFSKYFIPTRLRSEATTASIEPTPQAAPAAPAPAAGSDPTAAAAPPPTVDDLSYFNRLEKQAQPAEDLKAARQAETPPKAPPPAPKPAQREAAPAAAIQPPPATDGYVIQVAAMPEHGVADEIGRAHV